LIASVAAHAQLTATSDRPVIYGHHHINVANLDEHRKFWVDTLGGTPVPLGNLEVVKFTNVLLIISEQPPSGGSKGTTVNHIGFTVPNLRSTLDSLSAAGFPVVTEEEVPSTYEVIEGIAYNTVQDAYLAFVMAPDDIKIEFIDDPAQSTPVKLHHIHFATQKVAEMKDWYVKTFAATPGMRGNFQAADLPGVNLTYSPSDSPLAGTQGRSFDHIGFEIDGLEAFCEELERQGITFDMPYTEIASLGIAIAFFTDPFGTYIELTEGLDKL
jgi:catechol 2,3-dioxygenase-like lactoylglutathione lyase family enzyme